MENIWLWGRFNGRQRLAIQTLLILRARRRGVGTDHPQDYGLGEPPGLKITKYVLTGYENSPLYMIAQAPTRNRF